MYLRFLLWGLLAGLISCNHPSRTMRKVDVLIVGGGASGTMAGIQAARMGASVLIAEEGPWLGGMLTSAGVSAIDGNHRMHSGLWAEFRQKLYDHYGGPERVNTGWVSQVLFEPSVGAQILAAMAQAEALLSVQFHASLLKLQESRDGWIATIATNEGAMRVRASIVIDGTELGDVARLAGIPCDVGMDARADTGEEIAPAVANDIVQDLTYVVILKDYGTGADKTIPRPAGYDSTAFFCTCKDRCDETSGDPAVWDCDDMMAYGRLPNDKFMINWPIRGNDYYANVIDLTAEERADVLAAAKEHTRRYLYYLQQALGYRHLGIAEGEFPTEDGFPLIPYYRESRRIRGVVRFTLNDLARPFTGERALYRTGIAVGDYPIDHHHDAYPDPSQIPDIHFYPVPSFTLPLGTLIPAEKKHFLVVEKSISVTNIVNGTTRLQPVCMLLGQAAGVLAALAVQAGLSPAEVPVREVQHHLLTAGAYLQPYVDVAPDEPGWAAVQRIGSTGILKGEGVNRGWSNLTLFHPDSLMMTVPLLAGMREVMPGFASTFQGDRVTVAEAVEAARLLDRGLGGDGSKQPERIENLWEAWGFGNLNLNAPVTRMQMALLLDALAHPFERLPVGLQGDYLQLSR